MALKVDNTVMKFCRWRHTTAGWPRSISGCPSDRRWKIWGRYKD